MQPHPIRMAAPKLLLISSSMSSLRRAEPELEHCDAVFFSKFCSSPSSFSLSFCGRSDPTPPSDCRGILPSSRTLSNLPDSITTSI